MFAPRRRGRSSSLRLAVKLDCQNVDDDLSRAAGCGALMESILDAPMGEGKTEAAFTSSTTGTPHPWRTESPASQSLWRRQNH